MRSSPLLCVLCIGILYTFHAAESSVVHASSGSTVLNTPWLLMGPSPPFNISSNFIVASTTGCEGFDEDFSGKIAAIPQGKYWLDCAPFTSQSLEGTCAPYLKVKNAEKKGAIAVLLESYRQGH